MFQIQKAELCYFNVRGKVIIYLGLNSNLGLNESEFAILLTQEYVRWKSISQII
jgi:hypothetical protein